MKVKRGEEYCVGVQIWCPRDVFEDRKRRGKYVEEEILDQVGGILDIHMPCGAVYYYTAKNFPDGNIVCECGDTRHFVILWRTT